jgi:hypothetical protein
MESSREVHVGDLQELIFALTQDPWQPSEAKYRINVTYRGLPGTTGTVRSRPTPMPRFHHRVRRNRERELIQYEMNSTSSPTRSSG